MRSAPGPRPRLLPNLLVPYFVVGLGLLAPIGAQDEPPAPAAPQKAAPEEAAPAENATATETAPEPDETPPTDEEIESAIAALDSDDFRERESASKRVWEMGRAAEEQLRERLARATTAEMRYRGGKILDDFELGIYPDTPEAVRQLVRNFRKGDHRTRAAAVQQLADLGQTDLLARLVRGERDPMMREMIANVLADGVEQLAPVHIAEGEYGKAGDLLKVAALHPQGIKNYVAFLARTDGLEKAIAEQREIADESPVDTELLAWMLRVDGQLEEAAEIFDTAGDPVSARATLAAGGDLQAYVEANIDPSKNDITNLGYQLASAELRGDDDEVESTLAAIERYAHAMPQEAVECFKVLILNGHAPRALGIARVLEDADYTQMLLARYEFEEAAQSLGAESETAPYDAWLENFTDGFKVEEPKEVFMAIRPAMTMAKLCIDTGQPEEANRILRQVSRLLARTGDSQLQLVSIAAYLDQWDLAIELAVESMELETEHATIMALFRVNSKYAAMRDAIWEHLRETKPDQSTAAALRELGALLYRDPAFGEGDVEPVIASLRKAVDDGPAEQKAVRLLTAADLANSHSLHDQAVEYSREAFEIIGEDLRPDHLEKLGLALFASENYREAAEQFARAAKLDGSEPSYIYLHGLCLDRAGDKEAGEALRQRSALMCLGNIDDLSELSGYALENGDQNLGVQLALAVLRLARPESLEEELSYRLAIGRIAAAHLDRREFKEAAAAWRLFLLTSLRDRRMDSGATAMARYMSYAKVNARALLDAGETDAAVAQTEAALATVPSDSSMLEDVYQMLVDRGRAADADRFFSVVYEPSAHAAKTFPGYGQYQNNLAWLLSRCGKKLDEALAAARRALEIAPDSGAFLDTMAEVQFQRGARDKAVEYSEKAVAVLGDDPQLLHQLERFKIGEPTDR